MQYGVVEEFVTSSCEAVPGLLTVRHQGRLTVGLRARVSITGEGKSDLNVCLNHCTVSKNGTVSTSAALAWSLHVY